MRRPRRSQDAAREPRKGSSELASITLTTADNGRTVRVHTGDEIVLRLDENATTGFRWELERAEGPAELVADDYHLAPSVQFGSGGTRELRFHASAPGTARLELKHWQPWEGESSVVEHLRVRVGID